jgi:hypothetical protein
MAMIFVGLARRRRHGACPVTVGQLVDLNLKTIDGKTLTSKDLKERLSSSTSGPRGARRREQVPHMVKTNEEYASKGLQIIGVSLDQSVGDMKPFITENKMNWLHAFDGKRTLSKQFNVTGIPHVLFAGRHGWTGHPANLDAR